MTPTAKLAEIRARHESYDNLRRPKKQSHQDRAALLDMLEKPTEGEREELIALIMKFVRPEPVPLERKPTIAELEAMLNSEAPLKIVLNADGSISAVPAPLTVGMLADALMGQEGGAMTAVTEAEAAQSACIGPPSCGYENTAYGGRWCIGSACKMAWRWVRYVDRDYKGPEKIGYCGLAGKTGP